MDKRILFHGWALLSSSPAPVLCVVGGAGAAGNSAAPPPARPISVCIITELNERER